MTRRKSILLPWRDRRKSTADSSAAPLPSRSATASVLSTVELLEIILEDCSQVDLLVRIQRVCQHWKSVVEQMPLAYIDSVPPPVRNPNPGVVFRQFNPLLLKHFSALLTPNQHDGTTLQSIREAYREYLLLSYPWRTEGHGTGLQSLTIAKNGQMHSIFAWPNASWRRMQLATPPVTMLFYRNEDSKDARPQMISCPQGLRMGDLYDVAIQGVVCNMAGWKCGVVDIAWYTSEERPEIQCGRTHHIEQYVHSPSEYARRFPPAEDVNDDASNSDDDTSDSDVPNEEARIPVKEDVWDTIYIITASTAYRNPDKLFDIRLSTYVEALKRKLLCGKKPPQKYIVNL